jgi:hypothetical protein
MRIRHYDFYTSFRISERWCRVTGGARFSHFARMARARTYT